MRIRKHILAALFLAGALTASCAVTNEEDANYSYDRVMKAWINVNYPGLKPFGDTGVYLLEMEEGSGPGMTDSSYIKAHYTKRSLDGTITSTNIRRIAEQLGSYKNTNYYGGNFWRLDQGYLPDGLESVLKTMRSGGRVKLALPHSASSHDYSFYSAFSSTSESDNEIIDLTIDTVVTDIYDYQAPTRSRKDCISRNWWKRPQIRTRFRKVPRSACATSAGCSTARSSTPTSKIRPNSTASGAAAMPTAR